MKRLVVLALLAFSLLAAKPANKQDIPTPLCDPCPWVR
jgi:hypothetical protein